MDEKALPYLLAAGWLLLTLGAWGALGRLWWIWPLGVGAGCLLAGLAFLWAAARQRAALLPPPEVRP